MRLRSRSGLAYLSHGFLSVPGHVADLSLNVQICHWSPHSRFVDNSTAPTHDRILNAGQARPTVMSGGARRRSTRSGGRRRLLATSA